MKITVTPKYIVKNPENEVTSSEIFVKRQKKITADVKYADDGIFSKKIFGQPGSCECGELHKPGICKNCGVRVINPRHLPDYYIDLGVRVPRFGVNYKDVSKKVKSLLTFESFIYFNGEKYETIKDELDTDASQFKTGEILFGTDAILRLGLVDKAWVDANTTDCVIVPHPIYRPPLLSNDGKFIFGEVNSTLVTLIEHINKTKSYSDLLERFDTGTEEQYFLFAYNKLIYEAYCEYEDAVFTQFATGKKSYVRRELIAHKVTSAVKGVVVNRYDVDEDIVVIGDSYIETLFPYLYKHFDGDMEKINDYFVDTDEVVLMNRPPTICHLSIMALKPRVASCYKRGTFQDGALGKNHQSEYDEDIDTIGIRTIGFNPIVCDGFAGDFDGDQLLVISLFSDKAKQEARDMLPSKNYMNYANGTIRNAIIEDAEYCRNW